MRINTAFILCAGFGKRLNPLTLETPKPLIEFKNISVLETCINLIESLGIQQIALNTFYLKEQISNFINLKNIGQLTLANVVLRADKDLKLVRVNYLNLDRTVSSLSGGERQRITLAGQLSTHLFGVTYVLDEPTTGLHFEDVSKLLGVLNRLVDTGNTVVVIEHNLDVIKSSDWVIDMGPEGGFRGGLVVAQGTPEDVAKVAASYTGQFLGEILASNRKVVTKK